MFFNYILEILVTYVRGVLIMLQKLANMNSFPISLAYALYPTTFFP